jgi:hypothetical protein
MLPPLIPQEQECSRILPAIPKPSIPTQTLYHTGYQQALKDFAVSALLHQLKTYSDANFDAAWVALTTQEAETLAAVFIQTLTANLNGNLLTVYLDAIRSKTLDASNPLSSCTSHLP